MQHLTQRSSTIFSHLFFDIFTQARETPFRSISTAATTSAVFLSTRLFCKRLGSRRKKERDVKTGSTKSEPGHAPCHPQNARWSLTRTEGILAGGGSHWVRVSRAEDRVVLPLLPPPHAAVHLPQDRQQQVEVAVEHRVALRRRQQRLLPPRRVHPIHLRLLLPTAATAKASKTKMIMATANLVDQRMGS